jgi:hypothetical protein
MSAVMARMVVIMPMPCAPTLWAASLACVTVVTREMESPVKVQRLCYDVIQLCNS